jgi:hypothetical protein
MNTGHQARRALVVYESMFLNTQKIAAAVVSGLRDEGWNATPVDVRLLDKIPSDVDLIVLGAPTHAFSLSRPSTRGDAVRRGASPGRAELGLREWLTSLPPANGDSPVVAVFDTRVSKMQRLPTSAGRTMTKLVRRKNFDVIHRPIGFLVEGIDGPLCLGEIERAAAWGRSLGETYR